MVSHGREGFNGFGEATAGKEELNESTEERGVQSITEFCCCR